MLLWSKVEMGDVLMMRLRALMDRYPFIGDVRGKGLFIGAELVVDRTTKEPMDEKRVGAVVADCAANGVIIAQGGRFGGWSLYVQDGVPSYVYNYVGLHSTTITSSEPLPTGKATLRMKFDYAGEGKPGAGGTVTLYINDDVVGTGELEKTQPAIFSADETAGVGADLETVVTDQYSRATSLYTGKIDRVTIKIGDI